MCLGAATAAPAAASKGGLAAAAPAGHPLAASKQLKSYPQVDASVSH